MLRRVVIHTCQRVLDGASGGTSNRILLLAVQDTRRQTLDLPRMIGSRAFEETIFLESTRQSHDIM